MYAVGVGLWTRASKITSGADPRFWKRGAGRPEGEARALPVCVCGGGGGQNFQNFEYLKSLKWHFLQSEKAMFDFTVCEQQNVAIF